MVSRLLRTVALAVLFVGGRNLEAQEASAQPAPPCFPRFEFSIMGGYRFEGTITFLGGSYARIEIDNAPTYGFALGYNLNRNYEAEIQYSYASPAATGVPRTPHDPILSFDMSMHEIQVGFLGYFVDPGPRVRPYLELLLGASILKTDRSIVDAVKFTPGISLGVKAFLSDHVGLRAEVRYDPMYLWTTGTGTWLCFEDGGCWDTGARYLHQVEFRGGANFRF
jgi:hypothetical protein